MKRLGRIALVQFTAGFALLSVAGADECSNFFHFKDLNPTAYLSSSEYSQPNERSLEQYQEALLPAGVRFKDIVKAGDRVLDIGGGKGKAMMQMARDFGIKTTVINTQDFSDLYQNEDFDLTFIVGWAEEMLPRIATESQDSVLDLWGGFSYSIHKKEILEEIYRVLKPGKRAFALLSCQKVKAEVWFRGAFWNLPDYLSEAYPKIFSTRFSNARVLAWSNVIEIYKPIDGPATIDLALEYKQPPAARTLQSGPRSYNVLPETIYRPKER